MQLALMKLRENKKVNLHNRLKILKFLDYLGLNKSAWRLA